MKPRFISDLHLSEKHPELTQAFFKFLNESKEACTHLFILGDLFETWIGDDDFFFCHWLAETDEDIHNALRENGLDELVFTACYEANIHIDTACLTDDRAFPMRQTEQA